MAMRTDLPTAETFHPAHDCALCRLGTLTIPCTAGDVRRLVEVKVIDEGGGRYHQEVDPDGSPRRLHRTNVVQGEGPIPCPVMLIGEAPGFHEDREGLPFRPTAAAGRVLKRALDNVGLLWPHGGYPDYTIYEDADDIWNLCSAHNPLVYVTNVLKCRPENNKIDRFPDAVEVCRSTFLGPEIEAVQPRVVVCLGKVAALPWFGKQSALAFRQVDDSSQGGRSIMFIHAPHPSHIARGATGAMEKLVEALRVAKEVGYALR